MHSKQRGVTLIGWIILLAPIAILATPACAWAGLSQLHEGVALDESARLRAAWPRHIERRPLRSSL